MLVRVVAARSLEPEQLDRWSEIQSGSPSLASPYFRPEYTTLVARARHDIHVGLLQEGDEPVGFFPFQRRPFGVGAPVGSLITDYHGVIAGEDVRVDAVELLRACGLKTWGFRHAPAAQSAFEQFSWTRCDSAVIDLSNGFEGYVQARRESGSHMVASLGRKARKLEREHGPLRYVEHTSDPAVLALLMKWKTRQYRRTGALDALARGWVRRVVRLVHQAQDDAFAGVLSLLCAGDNPVAVHFGMRSSTVLHSWFPAYEPRFAPYSPGQLLFLKIAESAPASGIRAIDLGPGDGQHKLAMKSFGAPLLEGMVEVPSVVAKVVRTSRAARVLVKRTPLARRVRPVLRSLETLVHRA